jgi:uncharacterized membrane protein
MILKKDNFIFGFIMGLAAPFLGFAIFKYKKLGPLSYTEALQYLFVEPGFRMLTIAISLSLLANAVLFTIYINAHIDKTAKGIFAATIIYALTALSLKTFG